MLDDNKQKILDSTLFLNRRKDAKIVSAYEKSKTKFFILSIFLCLIIIGSIYFLSNKSNVSKIIVEGNIYLKEKDIVELSGLTKNSKFLLTNKYNVANKVKTNDLIEKCNVELLDDMSIKINVTEKKIIGYAFEDDNNVLVLGDDSRLVLNKANLYLIEKVPLLEGFSKEDIILIEKQLVSVDYKTINEISELHYYPQLKYQNMEIIMRDGNYVFTSVYGLSILNKYYDIVSSVGSSENNCYYFEDISGNAYMSACPWQSVEDTTQTSEE